MLCFTFYASIWKWIQMLRWAIHRILHTSAESTWEIQSKLVAIENLSRMYWITIAVCLSYCENVQPHSNTPKFFGVFHCVFWFYQFLIEILCLILRLSASVRTMIYVSYVFFLYTQTYNSLAMDYYLNRLINLGFHVCVCLMRYRMLFKALPTNMLSKF